MRERSLCGYNLRLRHGQVEGVRALYQIRQFLFLFSEIEAGNLHFEKLGLQRDQVTAALKQVQFHLGVSEYCHR